MLFLGTINTIVQEETFKKEPLPTVWKTDLKIHFYSDEAWKSNIVEKNKRDYFTISFSARIFLFFWGVDLR